MSAVGELQQRVHMAGRTGAAPAGEVLAAERGAQLRVDQLVEDRVLDLEQGTDPAGLERLRVGDGGRLRGVEDLALAVAVRLRLRGPALRGAARR